MSVLGNWCKTSFAIWKLILWAPFSITLYYHNRILASTRWSRWKYWDFISHFNNSVKEKKWPKRNWAWTMSKIESVFFQERTKRTFKNFFIYQNIISFDWVMNDFSILLCDILLPERAISDWLPAEQLCKLLFFQINMFSFLLIIYLFIYFFHKLNIKQKNELEIFTRRLMVFFEVQVWRVLLEVEYQYCWVRMWILITFKLIYLVLPLLSLTALFGFFLEQSLTDINSNFCYFDGKQQKNPTWVES